MTRPEGPSGTRPGARRRTDRLAVGVATAGGAGSFPKAPGTMGSVLGAGIGGAILASGSGTAYVIVLGAVVTAGFWSAHRAASILGGDSPRIVIDEVAGQMLTLAAVGPEDLPGLAAAAFLGFLLFRFFDILKPFPIRRLERLPGGVGVMADDLGAGVAAGLTLWILEPLAVAIADVLRSSGA